MELNKTYTKDVLAVPSPWSSLRKLFREIINPKTFRVFCGSHQYCVEIHVVRLTAVVQLNLRFQVSRKVTFA